MRLVSTFGQSDIGNENSSDVYREVIHFLSPGNTSLFEKMIDAYRTDLGPEAT